MRSLATKQPINDVVNKKNGERGRSRSISHLSTGMPMLQRQCACGGGCPRCQEQLGIQTKLKISEPGYKHEEEADERVANQAIPILSAPGRVIQRQLFTPPPGVIERDLRSSYFPERSTGGENLTAGMQCTPNGSHFPPIGTAHRPPPHLLPCFLTEAQVRSSSRWCLDSWQRHRGETCYREIPSSYCASADQYCYTRTGCCHNSRDAVSPVDPSSPGAGSICSTAVRCLPGHIMEDVL